VQKFLNLMSQVIVSMGLSATGVMASELSVVGTGDGIDVLRSLAAAYSAESSDTTVAVPPSIGSGGGIAAVGADKAILGRIARPLTEAEKSQGIKFVPIVRIPSAIYCHPSAAVTSLGADQLAQIYAGTITNWKEVGGADLKIRVVRREDEDSTLSVLRATMPGWKTLQLTTKAKTAVTTQDAVETVKLVEGAIGFGPRTKALEQDTTILRIDGKAPEDPTYPSAVTVGLIYKEATITPEAKAFIAFVAGAKSRPLIVSQGAVPVNTR
jgi:phosphate transport system substrate-binding protein